MPGSPSTRHLIPNWLMITLPLFVIVVLAVAIWGSPRPPGEGFLGHVLDTTTTTTHKTNNKGQKVDIETTTGEATRWDLLSLLVIPVAGGLIVSLVTNRYNKRQREREEAVQSLRAQDEILQKYLDQMSDLVVNKGLRPKPKPADSEPESHIRKLAQARTIAALLGLDSEHKRRPLKLVYELGLIEKDNGPLELKNAGLDGANLSELTLRDTYLKCIDLRLSDLKGADLEGANLHMTDLRGSDLSRADLKGANLTEANLLPYDEQDPERWSYHNLTKVSFVNPKKLTTESLSPRRLKWGRALSKGLPWYRFRRLTLQDGIPAIVKLTLTNLKGATLENAVLNETWLGVADLTNAVLKGANLTSAYLKDANLTGANLTGADLTNADLTNAVGLTSEELEQQTSALEGATMPNGQKYEDWLKSNGRGEDGENSGST
jgi:uncharacterized protein YjbI with pentapeptide repeats